MRAAVYRPTISKDDEGRTCLLFPAADIFAARRMVARLKPDVRYLLKIERDKKPRSTDQNSMMWELCQKLAEAIGVTRNEIYREMIRDYGQYATVLVSRSNAEMIANEWQAKGIGWITECAQDIGDNLVLRLYQGSSTYDTEQMGRIINALLDECKNLGIDVDDERVASLLAEN